MNTISVLPLSLMVLTKNEAQIIASTLEKHRFLDDVFVIDSLSTDGTPEIAAAAGAKVIDLEWRGSFAEQRNRADSHANHDWIMHLDADETISPELAREMEQFFSSGDTGRYVACRFPRRELFFGKWINHGGWYPQYKIRLYKKGAGSWSSTVHEQYVTDGPVHTFTNPILHDSYRDIATFVDKFNRYSTLDAQADFRDGKRFSFFKLMSQPLERFVGRYLKHSGWRDGFHGFAIASLIAFNYFIRLLKLWELQYRSRQNHPGK
ncbi:MAG TPA: glycosyltransferase family 2 protein [Geobacterales bacterium]|nr:glycosyltransferase family 2 protein [Geobacterales bacterium]